MSWFPVIHRIDLLAPPFDVYEFSYCKPLEEAIYYILTEDSGVSALIGTRVYPLVIPQNATLPTVVYQEISSVLTHQMRPMIGLTRARYQFWCWAATYTGADALAEAVRLALDGYSGTANNVRIDSIQLQDESDKIERVVYGVDRYRKRFDFFIWYHQDILGGI